jgi:hypothetical protein
MNPRKPLSGEPILPWAEEVTRSIAAPRGGKGVRVEGGRINAIRKAPHREPVKPFECYIHDVVTSGSGFTSITVKVRAGVVFLSEDWDDVATIAGLTTTECTLDALNEGVYLKMEQTGQAGTPTISLLSGATWSGYPQMWSYSPPTSSSDEPDFVWYQRLAYLRAPRTGEPAMKIGGTELVLDQVVKTNLIRRTLCVEGVTAYRIPQLHPWY